MPKAYEPFKPTIGRIVGVGASTGWFDVITDFGRHDGIYHGVSRGPGGVQESGGLQVGTFVWVLFGVGEKDCQIVGPVLPVWGVDPDQDPKQLSVFPQVSGFRLGQGLIGKMYEAGLGGLQNRPTDIMHDLVNGEWAMASPHGPGVGVELFRSWLRGSPMTGVTCWDDLVRIMGLDYEFLTLAQQDYDRRHGNSIVQVKSRVLYPDEALDDKLPRDLTITGAIHGGEHRFIAPQGTPGQARPALLHEYRGLDGTYALTSARAVILRRSVAVTVPEESRADAPQDGQEALLTDQPLDPDDTRQEVLHDPRPTLQAPEGTPNGLGWAQHVLDVIESEIRIRGRGGFDRLPVQWPDRGLPNAIPEDTLHTSYDANMWRALPQTVELVLDPIEKAKTFYVGESMVVLMPDGSVVIQDAHHSQVLMGGGNIMLSAPHDIILAPGRNLVTIAGQDVSFKAARHLDAAANEGRVSIKAETQLGLLGGNGGDGGVLIESRATNEALQVGTGTAQNLGGVVLKSQTGLYCSGTRVAVDATDSDLLLRSNGVIRGLATQCDLQLENGFFCFKDDGTAGYAFTDSGAILPADLVTNGQVLALAGGFFDGSLLVSESVAAGGSVTGSSVGPRGSDDKTVDNAARSTRSTLQGALSRLLRSLQTTVKAITTTLAAKLPLNRSLMDSLGFSFATSEQLRTNTDGAFRLPETPWQAISRKGHGTSRPWTENVVTSPSGDNRPTAPVPGYEAWSVSGSYQLIEKDLYRSLETGEQLPFQDGSDTLPDPAPIPLDNNYLIGNDT